MGDRIINCIEKDINKNTWVGAKTGLFRLRGTDSIATFFSGIITSIGIDEHNVKWFGTAEHLSYYISGMWNVDSADTKVSRDTILNAATNYPWFYSMLFETNGTKWFGSAYGLVKLSGDAEFINVSNSGLGRGYVTKLFIDKNDRKWFYAWGSVPLSESVLPPGYLALLSGDVWTEYNLINSPVDIGGVAAISYFNGSDMFIALFDIGGGTHLYHYSSDTWSPVTVPLTQYNTILYMWFDDIEKNLWVDFQGANGDNNLFITQDGNNWSPVPEFPVYDINKIKRLNNTIWIASPQGLIKYVDGIFTLYTSANSGLPNNDASSLDIDSKGNVWVGTEKGVAKFDGTNWIVYDRNNSPLSCDYISGLVIDPSDNIFLGTKSIGYSPDLTLSLGLVKFDGTTWTFYNSNNSGFPDVSYERDDINDLSIDASGKVWIATQGGVGVFDKTGVPVPVEFLTFNAIVKENEVKLTWTTATEINNKGFEIQRNESNLFSGMEQKDWTDIGFVEGNGTTTESNFYSFIDNNISSGTYKYRLKQIDYNGEYKYSKEIEIKIGAPSKFFLSQNYPNPFNPSTKINYSIPINSFVTIKVYDILGELITTLVNENKNAGNYTFNFEAMNFSNGVYFYHMEAQAQNSNLHFSKVGKMILLK